MQLNVCPKLLHVRPSMDHNISFSILNISPSILIEWKALK